MAHLVAPGPSRVSRGCLSGTPGVCRRGREGRSAPISGDGRVVPLMLDELPEWPAPPVIPSECPAELRHRSRPSRASGGRQTTNAGRAGSATQTTLLLNGVDAAHICWLYKALGHAVLVRLCELCRGRRFARTVVVSPQSNSCCWALRGVWNCLGELGGGGTVWVSWGDLWAPRGSRLVGSCWAVCRRSSMQCGSSDDHSGSCGSSHAMQSGADAGLAQ